MDDEVQITITLSKAAYERAARMAQNPEGIAGNLAGTLTTEEFIERYLEVLLEPEPPTND